MDLSSALLSLVLALTCVAVYYLKRNMEYWKRRGITHEEPHFFLGNMRGLRSKYNLGEIMANYYHKFKGCGPFAGIYVGVRPAVMLLETELMKRVLIKDFANFTDRGLYYNEIDDPLTGHIFFMAGQKWRNLRNKLSPAFTSAKNKFMYSTVQKEAFNFVDVLREKVQETPEQDVRDLLARFNTDIIASVAFGIECNSLRNPEDLFHKMGRKSIDVPRHNILIMGLIDSFPKLARKLGMRVLTEDVHQFFTKAIKETVEYREQHNVKRNDFLDILIELKNNVDDKSGLGGMTIDEVAAQVFVFYLAGFETSSSTMSFALYELAQNQELQQRLREEINEVFDSCKDGQISYEALQDIPYLDQVLWGKLYLLFTPVYRKHLRIFLKLGY